jgi:hypothetical protein
MDNVNACNEDLNRLWSYINRLLQGTENIQFNFIDTSADKLNSDASILDWKTTQIENCGILRAAILNSKHKEDLTFQYVHIRSMLKNDTYNNAFSVGQIQTVYLQEIISLAKASRINVIGDHFTAWHAVDKLAHIIDVLLH